MLVYGSTTTESTLTLRLRGGPPRRRVTFTRNTVDNEHLNRKKSKICCIYHTKNECNNEDS
ncbi:protein phosphatase 1 regulatory subunit 11 [Nematocida ausubeli]|uniref:Type 1 phosphatases regulator n=1 Tax=Nematocida ausubeli (strain ATCC PRA-371 / ERTm2) TaxID=1913371 RepID=H8ZFL1_NEMA1|nr:hypothetical protein NERG_02382 [Nematocida ausubeli]KAI5163588.1 protein phosphatase 1 regulatory subunit 11 [Nematocida ausubeli]